MRGLKLPAPDLVLRKQHILQSHPEFYRVLFADFKFRKTSLKAEKTGLAESSVSYL